MPHSSSETIASLASALAKAQRALVNPEKTMMATVRDGRAGQGAGRSFRYAPLSAGLELVRNTLGEHEIAVVQTTALDEGKTTILLKTMLAHASGEWIASDWPVCPMSDVASPQRMGAALTYARRYALFTMVGIAGEDDLDAPDLDYVSGPTEPTPKPPVRSNGAEWSRPEERSPGSAAHRPKRPAPEILSAEPSAVRRAALVSELESLTGVEDAATWAKRALPEKNRLAAVDARLLEEAFALRVGQLEQGEGASRESSTETATTVAINESAIVTGDALASDPVPLEAETESQRPDSLVPQTKTDNLPTPEPVAAEYCDGPAPRSDFPRRMPASPPELQKTRRRRDPEHLRFVAAQPCLICARTPSDAHHLRFAQVRALGRKVSDEFTVPLCRTHHRDLHRIANEPAWWGKFAIAPLEIAQKLWRQSHGKTRPEREDHSGTRQQRTQSRRGPNRPNGPDTMYGNGTPVLQRT